ncbi:MAG: site-specific integrase [Anaerolineales bacterium]|nr:site-specific integrase [Anaerolineales bacterium]
MAKRRGNHEGGLYRRKDGLWCAQVSLNGRRLTKYGKNAAECREWIKETLARIHGGLTYSATQITLETFMRNWLESKSLSIRPLTASGYRGTAERDILPFLGKMRLQQILPTHINDLYARLKEEGRGARMIQLAHVVLHIALEQAVREGILGRNPTDAVQRPKVERTEFQILNEEQVRQFMVAAASSPYGTLFYLALATGMRKGELLGLKWTDLDADKATLHVQRQLQQLPGQRFSLVPTKTKAGRRQIKLGQETLRRLLVHKVQQESAKTDAGGQWYENDLIFSSNDDTFIDRTKVFRELRKVLKSADLPLIRFHDLRHTSISILLEMGMPVNTVQQRSGHSKASVTTDIYGHPMARSQDEAAQRIDEAINPQLQ